MMEKDIMLKLKNLESKLLIQTLYNNGLLMLHLDKQAQQGDKQFFVKKIGK